MKPENMLFYAHAAMVACFVCSISIIYIAYGSDINLSIPTQVMLHIMLIIFPAFFKIGYVIRLNALKLLNRPVN